MRTALIIALALVCLSPAVFAAEAVLNGTFADATVWTGRALGGSTPTATGSIASGIATITTGNGGGNGWLYWQGLTNLVNGNSYAIATQTSHAAAYGPSAVLEMYLGQANPASSGGDYPNGGTASMIFKSDCWSSACAIKAMGPMTNNGGGSGTPWVKPAYAGTYYVVLKASGWGSNYIANWDNISVDGTLDVSDWSLY